MALSDEIKVEQKKVRDMTFSGKIKYIWDYYKIHIIVAIVVIAALSFFIRDWIRSSRPVYLNAEFMNTVLSYDGDSDITSDFLEYAGVDSEKYNCAIETALNLQPGAGDQMTMASQQKILGLFSAGEIDVMAAPLEVMEFYAPEGAFADLRDLMTQEEIDALEQKGYPIYHATCEGKTYPAGFYIINSPYLQKISEHGTFIPESEPVFAFTSCIKNTDAALKLLEMITQ